MEFVPYADKVRVVTGAQVSNGLKKHSRWGCVCLFLLHFCPGIALRPCSKANFTRARSLGLWLHMRLGSYIQKWPAFKNTTHNITFAFHVDADIFYLPAGWLPRSHSFDYSASRTIITRIQFFPHLIVVYIFEVFCIAGMMWSLCDGCRRLRCTENRRRRFDDCFDHAEIFFNNKTPRGVLCTTYNEWINRAGTRLPPRSEATARIYLSLSMHILITPA